MGFSGGGSNVLLPHRHDGRVSQDGGELDFNNITQSNSTSGQVFYSNGTAIQQLAIGTPGEALTVSGANLPSWVAAGGVSVARLQATLAANFLNAVTSTWTDIDNGAGDDLSVSIPDGVNYIACCTACINNWNYGSDCWMRFMEDGAAVTDTETEVAHWTGGVNTPMTATLFYQGSNTTGGAIILKMQCYNVGGSFQVRGGSTYNSSLWVTTIA